LEIRRKLARVDSAANPSGQSLPLNDRNYHFGHAPALSNSIELPVSASAASPDSAVKLRLEGLVLPKEANLAGAEASNLRTPSVVIAFDEQSLGKTQESVKRSPGDAYWSYGPMAGGLGGAAPKQTLSFGDQPELGAALNKDDGILAASGPNQRSLGRDEKTGVLESREKSEAKSAFDLDKNTQDTFAYRERFYTKSANEPVLAPEPAAPYGLGNSFQTFSPPQSALPELVSELPAQKPAAAPPNLGESAPDKLAEPGQKLSDGLGIAGKRPLPKIEEAKRPDGNSLSLIARAEQETQQIDKEDLGLSQPVVAPQPQPEIQTKDQVFSTFSLNVSDVSFRLAGASLEQGRLPAPATIRTEEFLNAFDYRDPEPAAGQRAAFAWDRATYPFAQNRDLLRVSIKTAAVGREPGRPLNLVLLLDNSGSMERADRVEIIRQALRVVASQLRTNDTFSVVTFARTARLFADGVSADQAGRVAQELGELPPQGGTNLEEAMNLAYQTALRHYLANGLNRVVLLTDGAANLGDTHPEMLKQKVEVNRKQGIALDCFGIGWEGYNDDLLEQLTRHGDGRYGFLNTPQEAGTEFADKLAGALQVAAADVKVQVEFNPARVTSFRQIGYARHQLKKEQFRDNTVDAAEIGAGESGNALYVIETASQGHGPIGVFRVRYKVPGTGDYREQEWTIPYTGTAVSLEKAGAGIRLGTVACAFAEWLAGSPYAAEVNPDQLLAYLNGVPAEYGVDPRPHRLEWMLRQAKALGGK
jgi:Mg-chelatase subunit ChlD